MPSRRYRRWIEADDMDCNVCGKKIRFWQKWAVHSDYWSEASSNAYSTTAYVVHDKCAHTEEAGDTNKDKSERLKFFVEKIGPNEYAHNYHAAVNLISAIEEEIKGLKDELKDLNKIKDDAREMQLMKELAGLDDEKDKDI